MVKQASDLLELVKNSKTVSDGSGKPPKRFENDEYISNSYLSQLKRTLYDAHQFFGNQGFLKFGNELHKRYLKPGDKKRRLSITEERQLKEMLDVLFADAKLEKFRRSAKLEIVSVEPIMVFNREQMVKVILDMQKAKRAKDLKTTSVTTEKAAIKSAIEYGYFRQAFLYSEAKKITDFDFEFIGKKKPYPRFTLPVNDFPHEKQQGREEALELASIHMSLKRFLKLQP